MDIVSKETRSRMMAGIRRGNTAPELAVRKFLHRHGFRYRLHHRKLPGTPDIVLPRYRLCIFIHGCFWHRHPGCKYASTPRTREAFWQAKFAQNIERDARNRNALLHLGWRVFELWECGIRGSEKGFGWLVEAIPHHDLVYLSWPSCIADPVLGGALPSPVE